MPSNHKKAFFLLLIILLSAVEIQSGPIACSACLTAVGAVFGGAGTSAGGCFALGFPPAVCTCLAGIGIGVGLWGVITCIPPCIAPTP